MTFSIITECAHCRRALHLKIDSEMNYQLREEDAAPLIFTPSVDFEELEDPSIIDAF